VRNKTIEDNVGATEEIYHGPPRAQASSASSELPEEVRKMTCLERSVS